METGYRFPIYPTKIQRSKQCLHTHWLPELLKEFHQDFPGVDFVFHQGDCPSVLEWIRTGAVDFGVVNPDAVTGIENVVLKQGAMLAVLPENHPLAACEFVPLELLTKKPFFQSGRHANSDHEVFPWKIS